MRNAIIAYYACSAPHDYFLVGFQEFNDDFTCILTIGDDYQHPIKQTTGAFDDKDDIERFVQLQCNIIKKTYTDVSDDMLIVVIKQPSRNE